MRLTGHIVGRVHDNPQSLVSKAGSPFIAFTVASTNERDKFPTYIKCAYFSKEKPSVKQGDLVVVYGDISAEGYLSKKDNQPRAALKIFCRGIDVVSEEAPKQQFAPEPKAEKASTGPVDDDVPF